jgi:dTDP-4-dehydrorhamnose reductase
LVKNNQTGIFHVTGPDFLSRYDFAIAASKILGLSTETLHAATTPELAQIAARPLLGGLSNKKLQLILGPNYMRNIDTGIRDWQTSTAPST